MRYSPEYNVQVIIKEAKVVGRWVDYFDTQGNKYSSKFIKCVPMGVSVELRVKDDLEQNEVRIMEVM